MTFAGYRSGESIPVYDGVDNPHCEYKMNNNIKAQNNDMWVVVRDGVIVRVPNTSTIEEKCLLQLDSQAIVFVINHLSKGQYGRVKTSYLKNWSGTMGRRLVKAFLLTRMQGLILRDAHSTIQETCNECVQAM